MTIMDITAWRKRCSVLVFAIAVHCCHGNETQSRESRIHEWPIVGHVSSGVTSNQGRVDGVWEQWTEWSYCSKSCGQGLATRSRRCRFNGVVYSGENIRDCSGRSLQYQSCNEEECPGKVLDYRTVECRKMNREPFRGRYYHWERTIDAQRPCVLTCKAIYYKFIYKFADAVQDGTTCMEGSSDYVCVRNQCLKIGCDGVVASGAEFDKCGVCNGDGKSCRIISGIFTRVNLARSHNYNLITRIPAGACNINVTEMARSRNYLSLKITNGSSVVNGNFRPSPRGTYRAAGTVFTYGAYSGRTCPGQCIMAPGPTTKSIDIELLYYRRNPGIKYQFTIPTELMQNLFTTAADDASIPSHSRNHRNQPHGNHQPRQPQISQRPSYRVADSRSRTSEGRAPLETGSVRQRDSFQRGQYVGSRTAPQTNNRNSNPGYRTNYPGYDQGYPQGDYREQLVGQTVVKQSVISQFPNNRQEGNHIYIDNSLPKLSAQNIPDSINYYWRISGFTNCTHKCGGGTQETRVICMKRNTNVIVTEDNCDPNLRPATQRILCNTKICSADWDGGNWTDCSVTCGVGMQTRQVLCKQRVSPHLSITVDRSRCARKERPESSRSCKQVACASWHAGEWEKCSANCGRGEKTRKVYCKSVEGGAAPAEQCEGIKPESKAICDMGSCAQGWFHTRWSETCSSDCGKGYRIRTVYCSAADGTPLSETKCTTDKPRDKKRCQHKKPCGGIWFEGPWSGCSATCGEGVKKRDVVCMKKLGNSLFAVVKPENCQGTDKPVISESCGPLPPCPSEWFMTPWSECSKSCDTGVKTREVKCLDSKLQPSTSCPTRRRPSKRHTCNRNSCELPQLDQDPHCVDKMKICYLVSQARLCNYPYYKTECCQTCKLHKHKHRRRQGTS